MICCVDKHLLFHIQHLEWKNNINEGWSQFVVFVSYLSVEDEEKVKLIFTVLSDSKSAPGATVVLGNINNTSKDLLSMLVENISGLDESCWKLEIIWESNKAVVTFNNAAGRKHDSNTKSCSSKQHHKHTTVFSLSQPGIFDIKGSVLRNWFLWTVWD